MAASLGERYCPLCKTLGETKMSLSREKGLLKIRLETNDIQTSLKEQMAKCYGYKEDSQNSSFVWFGFLGPGF